MILKMNGSTRIENLRHYPAEIVEKLRALLSAGAIAQPDPHRNAFYDVENGSCAFYIHLCPNGKVWLLASWQKPAPLLPREAVLLTAARP